MDVSVSPQTRLSVVVPVGPGDCVSPRLLVQLGQLPSDAQVFVVNCEPVAEAAGEGNGPRVHWLQSPAGRSQQQNAGAAAANGDWLWFLHADTALADETLPALADFINTGVSALGYFDLRFLGDGPAVMRLNAAGVWLRSRWLRLPFGDQGFVIPRKSFNAVGGFDPATMRGEDHQLVWRVRHAGLPVRAVGAPLYTSARRYAACGWATTTCGHLGETWRQAWRFSRPGRTP